MTQERACNNPVPAHGGDDCVGDDVRSTGCKNIDCPGKIYKEVFELSITFLLYLIILLSMLSILCFFSLFKILNGASLIQNIKFSGHMFGNQFTFITTM